MAATAVTTRAAPRRYLVVNATPASDWDEFVSSSPCGHFMQSHAWGRLQRHEGWTPHYLAMGEGTRLCAAALLLSRPVPVAGIEVFYAPRGPVVFGDPAVASEFVAAVRTYVRDHGGAFLRTDPYLAEAADVDALLERSGLRKLPHTWSYWNAPKYVLWLDLGRSEEELFQGMATNCQKDVRAGYRKGVDFTRGGAADLPDFYRLLVAMSQKKGLAVHDADYYARLYAEMNRSGRAELFLARKDSAVIAASMSIRYGPTAWLMYAASDQRYFKLRINRNVQWEMIKWARESGCHRYDFRGTATGDPPQRTDPGYGVYEFKKSFGPEFVRLAGYYDLVTAAPAHALLRLAEDRVLPRLYQAKVWLDERRNGAAGAAEE